MSRSLLVLASVAVCALGLVGCSSDDKTAVQGDISRLLDVKSSFGPEYKVNTIAPTGIDPRLLTPQPLPQGITFDPAGCVKFATGLALPQGLKGNMAAVTAEGAGARYIAIAVETSEDLPVPEPGDDCKKVAFGGPGVRGQVEVTESPTIEGVHTLATHRVVEVEVRGKPATGEIYNYVANFGSFLVIVTANPLAAQNAPAQPVDTQKARDLLTSAVQDVRGS